jgi:hypothetical protein
MKAFRFVPVLMLALSGVLVTAGAASAATSPGHRQPPGHRHHGSTYNCTGGNVPPGVYNSMVITGVCYMPAGTIVVRRDLKIAQGALLDAATTGDPAGNPLLPATLLVGGNVSVGSGAVLVLGCSPAGGCHAVTYDRIGGNLTAFGAEGVVIQAVSIGGNATVIGGGGGVAGGANSGACFASPIPAPWSEDAALSQGPNGSPQYTDFEDSSIGGNLSVIGLQTCYIGSFRDQVGRNVSFIGNTTSDPDGNELGSNVVGRNLTCLGNLPATQFGDSSAAPNIVGRRAIGECGFKVLADDPAPAPGSSAGIAEHLSVSAWSLQNYSGTHTQVGASTPISLGTPSVTESGDTLVAELDNVVFAGNGLNGSATVVPSAPPGSSGELVVVTVRPNGSESFEAFDTCSCSFDGQSGTVDLTAYGTVSPNGSTRGTFLVTSGGSSVGGGLDTLAGYGRFSSYGESSGTLRLVEHLGIT